MYHHVSLHHLGHYTTEFEDRHNSGPLDTAEQIEIIAQGAVDKYLPYTDLVGLGTHNASTHRALRFPRSMTQLDR